MNVAERQARFANKDSVKTRNYEERRSAIRMAFGKANLFPLPKQHKGWNTEWFSCSRFGRNFKKLGSNQGDRPFGFQRGSHRNESIFTYHLRKKDAYKILVDDIYKEAKQHIGKDVNVVIWRHTGGYGNFAKHFLCMVDGVLCLYTKVERRYRALWNNNDDNQDVSLMKQREHAILAHLADNLFISAVDALGRFRKTGQVCWFPESRDEWVRENFPKKDKNR